MTNPNDPVKPVTPIKGGQLRNTFLGLTKREYFAAMAMQGILSNGDVLKNGFTVDFKEASVLEAAIYIADNLIAELNKTTKQEENTL